MDRNLIFFSPYNNQNLVENLQNQIMISPELHSHRIVDSCDLYRYEDGGGDARALLLGEEENHVSYSSTPEGQMKMILDMGRSVSVVNPVLHTPAEGAASGVSRSFGRLPYLNLGQRPTCSCPFILIGHEQYVLQPDTIFVLGMRQSITKNDIIVCFGKIGHIKVDEGTNKPKIFVYKDKLTGRSKGEATITYVSPLSAQAAIAAMSGRRFMGHTLTVLPAYLSTRSGTVRYSYPRKLATEQQLEPRSQRWKPASDNWSCLVCRNSNFVWRSSCNRCQAEKGTAPTAEISNSDRRRRPHKNDWLCDGCNNINFWYRKKCNLCNSEKAETKAETKTETHFNGDSSMEKEKWELMLQSSAEDLLSSHANNDDVSTDI
ncbi:transcription initiation factor TFIID subunit 15 [Drosophila obscura]|uniref:transcription initiation factor TFIID subunit 15 n=1 Tax=Drosophila obscura TaxID=7282 RepID=UPI001BB10C35|nr:transcription initiation factor TFIID subunit 15 [Drosophila obscura]